MNQEDLTRIKDYCAKATAGPWVADINIYGTGKKVCTRDKEIALVNERHAGLTPEQAMDNAMFMAHARTDLPAAIAEIERLKEQLEKRDAQWKSKWELSCETLGNRIDEIAKLEQELANLKSQLEQANAFRDIGRELEI